jgi:hypothetical protein
MISKQTQITEFFTQKNPDAEWPARCNDAQLRDSVAANSSPHALCALTNLASPFTYSVDSMLLEFACDQTGRYACVFLCDIRVIGI